VKQNGRKSFIRSFGDEADTEKKEYRRPLLILDVQCQVSVHTIKHHLAFSLLNKRLLHANLAETQNTKKIDQV